MRRGTGILLALTLGWALTAGVSTAAADTHVSLTFDDGNADQLPAVQMMADHGMEGTFYIITNRVGQTSNGYMTWDQVQSVYDARNEIGGHTRDHVHLNDSTFTDAQIQDQICGGRQDLLARGYPQVSFAYPFGDHDARSEGFVQSCGYLSGRREGGLGDTGEPKADTIPPQDQWLVRTRHSIDSDNTPSEIESWITAAEAVDAGNGSADAWITLIFHHLCDPDVTTCDDPEYITPSDFDSLLDWLQPREPTTRVETMARVMDPIPPSSEISCNGAACQTGSYDDPVSVTLSAADTGPSTGASGVKEIRYTTDGSDPDGASPVYSGPITVGATGAIKWRAEDNAGNVEPVHSQMIEINTPPPPPPPGSGPAGDNGGTLGAFSFKSLPNGIGKLTLDVTGPGELEAMDANARAARIRRTSKSVAQSGSVTVVIKASRAGRRILRRKGRLRVPLFVTFTPPTGSPVSRTVKAKLKLRTRLES